MNDHIESIRKYVIEELNFDLYMSPRFIEHLICFVCSLRQTDRMASCDGIHDSGFRVEIKHSLLFQRISKQTSTSGKEHEYTYDYFSFCNLQGAHGKGKGADVFVLVGFDGTKLRFFVLPATIVGELPSIDINIAKRIYEKRRKWLKYEVAFESLADAVKQRSIPYFGELPFYTQDECS